MRQMLNLANTLSDDNAEYLRDLDINSEEQKRSMDLYVSHNDVLVAIGYENDCLVWFSKTKLSDTFLSRRIFESMKQSCFYRRVELTNVLAAANLNLKDLQYMCHAKLSDIETACPVFSGCIVGNSNTGDMTGIDFANIIAVLPVRLRSSIEKIGSEDEILTELDKDYQRLETIYNGGVEFDEGRQEKVTNICEKWIRAECIKLCDRAAVRSLYHDVCYFAEKISA